MDEDSVNKEDTALGLGIPRGTRDALGRNNDDARKGYTKK
jgi:hypothetical protein